MNALKIVVVCCLLLNCLSGDAQFFTSKNYPKGYFTWPVGATKALAANFGELRPNHYHMGLDCKTDQKENVPVYAAAEGYIARVKIEPSGFGRAIYINHPNGLTTLYAHLNDFYPALEKYITDQQYLLKSWKVFLDIPSNLFPVTKGQFIAYSGNTGGSQGPHLHFEVRDTKTDKSLNPLLFGFPVTDDIAPDILRLAVYDRRISVYEQTPRMFTLKKINGNYTTIPALIIANTDKISFAISAYDRYTGSTNKNGIFEADLFEDERPVVGFQLDSISYDETRYLNAHIDYKLRNSGGPFVQHLSRLPGYTKGIYKEIGGDGVIKLNDNDVHQIRIGVKDADGNESLLNFSVQRSWIKATEINNNTTNEHNNKLFIPGNINIFENENISFYLPENILYDSVRVKLTEIPKAGENSVFAIQNGITPCHAMFPVTIKCNNTSQPDKMVMRRFWANKDDYAKAEAGKLKGTRNWYKASFREFGYFQLLEDVTPPTIVPVGFREGMNCTSQSRIVFIITDNTELLQNFSATIDDNWIRFSNDKGRAFIYKFDEHCPPGAHTLKIHVEDCVGNVAEKVFHFTR